jgi:hypothetical protein
MVACSLWSDFHFFELRVAVSIFLKMVQGSPVEKLEESFEEITNEKLDFEVFGFQTIVDFLMYIPNDVKLEIVDGVLWAYGV